MKRIAAAVAIATVGAAALAWASPAGAGVTPTYTVNVTPNPSVVGTALTVTPGTNCPDTATEVALRYFSVNGALLASVVLPLEADGSWVDTVTPDHAGNYSVSGQCQHQPAAPNAGHLAVSSRAGNPAIVDAYYGPTAFLVNGLVVATPASVNPGGTVTFSPTEPSRCNNPLGTVTLTIKDPDGVAVVTDATPTVDGTGSFALQQALTKVGTYTVTGMCHRTEPIPASGHLAVAAAVQNDDFSYTGSALVTPAPTTTTTTTAPPQEVAAEAVEATPTFTG